MWRWLKRLTLALLAALAVGAGGLYYYATYQTRFVPATLTYDLRYGVKPRTVARELTALGVLRHPVLFALLMRVRGDAPYIKAGNYEIESPVSPLLLLRKLTRGDATQSGIRFIEGWTFRQVRQALDAHDGIVHDTHSMSNEDIARKLGIEDGRIEGWIFPESYHFARGTSDLAVLRRAHRLMQKHLGEQWDKRDQTLPLGSPYEALVLASIVEKETGKPAERALVSAVFVNRMRLGMRLQTDPAVIYGMGNTYSGSLRRRDLQTDTPWNTYTRAGLPPTPIAMPGLASLQAALHPMASPMLYFVARGDGSSHFSQTLDEHNAAVFKYLRTGDKPAATNP